MKATGRVLALCMNPAWQRVVVLPTLQLGRVNRAAAVSTCGGGKGINAARAIGCAGGTAAVAWFAGGTTGESLDRELQAAGIGSLKVDVAHPTRVCTTLIDLAGRTVTEVIEPSGPVEADQVEAMRRVLRNAVANCAAVAICGTCPPGVPDSLSAEASAEAKAAGAIVILDAVSPVAPTLAGGVDVLKVNADELRRLGGRDDLQAAASRLLESGGAGWIAVTDGPRQARLFGPGGSVAFTLPDLGQDSRNTIGAGDCATGILLWELAGRSLDLETVADAFTSALAAACASCLTDLPADRKSVV